MSFTHDFLILPDLSFKVILGTDCIIKSKVVIDLAQGSYFLENKSQRKIKFVNSETLSALQGLSNIQNQELDYLLSQFIDVLNNKVGCTDVVQCELKVTGEPKAQKPYPISPAKREILKNHILQMLEIGVIRPSTSLWASPVYIQIYP